MSFAENLKKLRKEQGLSQEELAEMMEVSRQAVSKWEQGESFPEVEKLLVHSWRFNISLDSLLSAEIAGGRENGQGQPSGTIVISSPNENVIASCCKVMSSQRMRGNKNSPRYSLFGVASGGSAFWGEPATFLGWYADEESLSKEVQEIRQAIRQGIPGYELKYSAKVERKGLRLSLVE